MQKWRHDYLLKMETKQNSLLDDEAGFTLVELLASISILSIVILLAGSIHIFGQRQFIAQSESASQANDFSHALTVMTTDLRKLDAKEVTVGDGNEITVGGEKGKTIYYVDYDRQLIKGNTVLVESIESPPFSKGKDEYGEFIKIEIKSIAGSGLQKKYETKIYFRR